MQHPQQRAGGSRSGAGRGRGTGVLPPPVANAMAAFHPFAPSMGWGAEIGILPQGFSPTPGNAYFNQAAPGGAMFPGAAAQYGVMPGMQMGMGRGGRSMPPSSSSRGPSRGEQNDYSQHFVDTGLRPHNFIRDVDLADRFEEYPKLKELITRKDSLIAERATPPMYMQCDLKAQVLCPEIFGTKFDVILVDPPWEEYLRRSPGIEDSLEWWTFEEIINLRIEAIADTPSFIFLWVGDAEGLDQGRQCLKKKM